MTTTFTSGDTTYFCGSCGQQMSYMYESHKWTCINPNCPIDNQPQTFTPRKCLKHNYEWGAFGQCMYCQGEHFWNKEDNPNAKYCEKHGMFYLGVCGQCMVEATENIKFEEAKRTEQEIKMEQELLKRSQEGQTTNTTKETKEQVMSVINNNQRKYLPTLAEKLDRLCISQLKELLIVEHKVEYAKEIKDIMHDIDLDIKEGKLEFSAKTLRELIILVIMNREIWLSESAARSGKTDGNDLLKSHSLNSLRNQAKNRIQEIVPNSRKDYKIDVLTKEYIDWTPSWDDDK